MASLRMALCPCHLPGPSSKFRHTQGSVLHRDSHITNLKGLSLTTPGESDGFCANQLHVAVPLLSSGGQVAVLEVRDFTPRGLLPRPLKVTRMLRALATLDSPSTDHVLASCQHVP